MFNLRLAPPVLILSLAVSQLPAPTVFGHLQAKTTVASAKNEVTGQTGELARLRAQLVEATKDYKASLEQLLTHYEAEVKRADERVVKSRELYNAGLATKRALDEDELSAETARAKSARAQEQLKSADVQIAETLAEATSEETARKLTAQKKRRERTREGRVYYVRFVIVGEVTVYDYSGAVRGHVIKRGQKILVDSRR